MYEGGFGRSVLGQIVKVNVSNDQNDHQLKK